MKSELVPRIRFGEFEGDWTKRRISSLLKRYSEPVDVVSDEVYYQIGSRSHGKGLFHKPGVTGEELGNKRVFWVHPDAFIVNIVFAWEQSVAVTSESEQGMIASHRFPMFLPLKHSCDLDYILHYFLTRKGKVVLELASPGGAGRNRTLGQDYFAKSKIPIPTLPEQQKIAAFLTAVDGRLAGLRRQVAALERYKRGVMQGVFGKNKMANWSSKTMDKVAKLKTGFTPSTKVPEFWDGDIPWLSISDMGNSRSVYHTKRTISQAGTKGKKIMKKGTLLMSFKLSIGKLAFAGRDMYTNEAICSFNLYGYVVDDFLYYYLSSVNIESFGSQAAKGVTLNKDSLNSIVIRFPSLPEQHRIATFLRALDDRIGLVERQLAGAEAFKRGLLQGMFV